MGFINYKVIKPYSISYLQRGKNMSQIVKFFYVKVIFLSLFLVAMNAYRK